ncbi:hypothetical protein KM043_018884, partial [Ampulex compressa]
KRLVSNYVNEGEPEHLPPELPEVESPNVDLRERLITFLRNLEPVKNNRYETHILERICDELVHWSDNRILEEISLYLLKVLPPKHKERTLAPAKQKAATKRKERREEYAKTQELWKRNPGRCLRAILK